MLVLWADIAITSRNYVVLMETGLFFVSAQFLYLCVCHLKGTFATLLHCLHIQREVQLLILCDISVWPCPKWLDGVYIRWKSTSSSMSFTMVSMTLKNHFRNKSKSCVLVSSSWCKASHTYFDCNSDEMLCGHVHMYIYYILIYEN